LPGDLFSYLPLDSPFPFKQGEISHLTPSLYYNGA
jgi:hypothetical protein